MSILSSINAGKSFYLDKIKEWYLQNEGGRRIPVTKAEDVEISLQNGRVKIFDKNSYDNSICVYELPDLPTQFSIELQRMYAGRPKEYSHVIINCAKTNGLKANFTNPFIKIRNSQLGAISNWKANTVIFEMIYTTNNSTMFCPTIVDKIENCEFKHLSMGYKPHYYAENEQGGNVCSVLLDNIKNCKINTLVFTPDNIKYGLKELNNEAQEILDRFFTNNEVRLAALQLKNTSKYIKLIKKNGIYELEQVPSAKVNTINTMKL